MTGKSAAYLILCGALLSFSLSSTAETLDTTADLIQQPGYQTSWQSMVKGQAKLPGWARKGVGTSTPPTTVNWQGQNYLVGNICKPHDCSNNFMLIAFKSDKSQVWGVRVEVAAQPGEIEHPKKYAKYQWLGKPNDSIKALLNQQLAEDPNWK